MASRPCSAPAGACQCMSVTVASGPRAGMFASKQQLAAAAQGFCRVQTACSLYCALPPALPARHSMTQPGYRWASHAPVRRRGIACRAQASIPVAQVLNFAAPLRQLSASYADPTSMELAAQLLLLAKQATTSHTDRDLLVEQLKDPALLADGIVPLLLDSCWQVKQRVLQFLAFALHGHAQATHVLSHPLLRLALVKQILQEPHLQPQSPTDSLPGPLTTAGSAGQGTASGDEAIVQPVAVADSSMSKAADPAAQQVADTSATGTSTSEAAAADPAFPTAEQLHESRMLAQAVLSASDNILVDWHFQALALCYTWRHMVHLTLGCLAASVTPAPPSGIETAGRPCASTVQGVSPAAGASTSDQSPHVGTTGASLDAASPDLADSAAWRSYMSSVTSAGSSSCSTRSVADSGAHSSDHTAIAAAGADPSTLGPQPQPAAAGPSQPTSTPQPAKRAAPFWAAFMGWLLWPWKAVAKFAHVAGLFANISQMVACMQLSGRGDTLVRLLAKQPGLMKRAPQWHDLVMRYQLQLSMEICAADKSPYDPTTKKTVARDALPTIVAAVSRDNKRLSLIGLSAASHLLSEDAQLCMEFVRLGGVGAIVRRMAADPDENMRYECLETLLHLTSSSDSVCKEVMAVGGLEPVCALLAAAQNYGTLCSSSWVLHLLNEKADAWLTPAGYTALVNSAQLLLSFDGLPRTDAETDQGRSFLFAWTSLMVRNLAVLDPQLAARTSLEAHQPPPEQRAALIATLQLLAPDIINICTRVLAAGTGSDQDPHLAEAAGTRSDLDPHLAEVLSLLATLGGPAVQRAMVYREAAPVVNDIQLAHSRALLFDRVPSAPSQPAAAVTSGSGQSSNDAAAASASGASQAPSQGAMGEASSLFPAASGGAAAQAVQASLGQSGASQASGAPSSSPGEEPLLHVLLKTSGPGALQDTLLTLLDTLCDDDVAENMIVSQGTGSLVLGICQDRLKAGATAAEAGTLRQPASSAGLRLMVCLTQYSNQSDDVKAGLAQLAITLAGRTHVNAQYAGTAMLVTLAQHNEHLHQSILKAGALEVCLRLVQWQHAAFRAKLQAIMAIGALLPSAWSIADRKPLSDAVVALAPALVPMLRPLAPSLLANPQLFFHNDAGADLRLSLVVPRAPASLAFAARNSVADLVALAAQMSDEVRAAFAAAGAVEPLLAMLNEGLILQGMPNPVGPDGASDWAELRAEFCSEAVPAAAHTADATGSSAPVDIRSMLRAAAAEVAGVEAARAGVSSTAPRPAESSGRPATARSANSTSDTSTKTSKSGGSRSSRQAGRAPEQASSLGVNTNPEPSGAGHAHSSSSSSRQADNAADQTPDAAVDAQPELSGVRQASLAADDASSELIGTCHTHGGTSDAAEQTSKLAADDAEPELHRVSPASGSASSSSSSSSGATGPAGSSGRPADSSPPAEQPLPIQDHPSSSLHREDASYEPSSGAIKIDISGPVERSTSLAVAASTSRAATVYVLSPLRALSVLVRDPISAVALVEGGGVPYLMLALLYGDSSSILCALGVLLVLVQVEAYEVHALLLQSGLVRVLWALRLDPNPTIAQAATQALNGLWTAPEGNVYTGRSGNGLLGMLLWPALRDAPEPPQYKFLKISMRRW